MIPCSAVSSDWAESNVAWPCELVSGATTELLKFAPNVSTSASVLSVSGIGWSSSPDWPTLVSTVPTSCSAFRIWLGVT